MHRALLFAATALAVMLMTSRTQACPATALVLAVDGSGSISDDEYEFQKSAMVAALSDPSVMSAIRTAGGVSIAVVFWGDGEFATQAIDWVDMDGLKPPEQFFQDIKHNQRVVFGNTGIAAGIWAGLDLLSQSRLCARRLIVDISGDGQETIMPKRGNSISLLQARRRSEQMGVTINALAISDEEAGLAAYYENMVIMGPNSFVMEIRTFADFARAIKQKLIRELS